MFAERVRRCVFVTFILMFVLLFKSLPGGRVGFTIHGREKKPWCAAFPRHLLRKHGSCDEEICRSEHLRLPRNVF